MLRGRGGGGGGGLGGWKERKERSENTWANFVSGVHIVTKSSVAGAEIIYFRLRLQLLPYFAT